MKAIVTLVAAALLCLAGLQESDAQTPEKAPAQDCGCAPDNKVCRLLCGAPSEPGEFVPGSGSGNGTKGTMDMRPASDKPKAPVL